MNLYKDGVDSVGWHSDDEPLFQGFPLAVGVSSVERYRARMKHLPAYITQGDGAVGFVELVDRVLSGT